MVNLLEHYNTKFNIKMDYAVSVFASRCEYKLSELKNYSQLKLVFDDDFKD